MGHPQPKPKCIVHIVDSRYVSGGKLVLKREVYTLHRQSNWDELGEQLSMCGADLEIEGLATASPGVYELLAYNFSRNWETGIVDDYDLKLIPVKDG